jgi:hypothetical protein
MADDIHIIATVTPEAVSVITTGGIPGAPGAGVPAGGTLGQTLLKTGPENFAAAWVDPSALGMFGIANRFSELDTAQAKTEARQNLELQSIDCGEFL